MSGKGFCYERVVMLITVFGVQIVSESEYENSLLASARHAHRAWLRSVFSLTRPDLCRDTVAARDKKVAQRLFPYRLCHPSVILRVKPEESLLLSTLL